MPKIIKKKTSSKVTASKKVALVTEPVTSIEDIKVCKQVDKIEANFGNGELNQVVEKLNEVIEILNKCQ